MKLFFPFVIICFFSFNVKSQAQQYGYLNNTCIWGFCADAVDAVANKFYASHFTYFMNGDTTIKNQLYYQLYKKGIDSMFNLTTNTFISTNPIYEYMGALREDTAAFFFIFRNDTSIVKLLDFDINYSNSIPNMYANLGCNTPKQPINYSNLSMFTLNGVSRYSYIYNNGLNRVLYEGIGTNSDFLQAGTLCGIGIEAGSTLTCFSKDNAIVYFDTTHCKCNINLQPGGSNCTAKFCYNTVDSGSYLFTTFYNLSSTITNDSIQLNLWEFGPTAGTFKTQSFNWISNYWDTLYPYRLQIFTKKGCTAAFQDTIKVGTNCGFLPIAFISLNVNVINNIPNIFWQTNDAKEIKYFTVQRSYDGKNFGDIAKVLPTNKNKLYKLADNYITNQFVISKVYYRIICIKYNGDKSYSNVANIEFFKQNKFVIYPNPVKGLCNIVCKNVKQINITDCFGKSVYSANNLSSQQQLNTFQLKKGIYFLHILFNDGNVLNEKLLRE